jgi:carbamoyltransferase
MIVMGVKAIGHDTGAAIVGDDGAQLRIVAISEARLNRVKHSYRYPLRSIEYCLSAFGLKTLDDVDVVAFDWHEGHLGKAGGTHRGTPAAAGDEFLLLNFALHYGLRIDDGKLRFVDHIVAHAATAFALSPFDEAAILVADGGLGICRGRGAKIDIIDLDGYGTTVLDGHRRPKLNATTPGHMYEFVTTRMGFSGFDAGKTMALASFRDRFEREDVFDAVPNRRRSTLIDHRATEADIARKFPAFDPRSAEDGFDRLVSHRWVNLARQAQDVLEADIQFLADEAVRKSGSRNLCLAGGVALSCVTNRRLHDSGHFDGMFIQPAASDEGIALGCALAAYYDAGGRARTVMTHAYLGRPNDPASLPALLASTGWEYGRADPADIARMIATGKVVARCAGGAEYGPRALGNRSILADPRHPGMVEHLNRHVKHREGFRPFAPSCHHDKRMLYFDMPMEGPFMIMAAATRPDMRDCLPAITHVDGSCRPQTVRPEQNPAYYDLIRAFGEQTGIYCLLNTSFNDNGEPIVETYEDALHSFARMSVDCLVLDDHVLRRPADGRPLNLVDNRKAATGARYHELRRRYCDIDRVRRVLDGVTLLDGRPGSAHLSEIEPEGL